MLPSDEPQNECPCSQDDSDVFECSEQCFPGEGDEPSSAPSISPKSLMVVGGSDQFSVTDCDPEMVVVSGEAAEFLQKDTYLIFYGEGNSETSCGACSPLFRKIEAVEEVDSGEQRLQT